MAKLTVSLVLVCGLCLFPLLVYGAEQHTTEIADSTSQNAAEIKASRPDADKGPTKVAFRMFVLDVNEINGAAQHFTANVFLSLTWKDDRLANSGLGERILHVDEVWTPQILIANRFGLISHSLPEVVHVFADGTVNYRQRYTGQFSQPLNLSAFPVDKHDFHIQFASAAYTNKDLEFFPGPSLINPDIVGGSMADELSLPDWEITDYSAFTSAYAPVPEVSTAGFVFQFEARRYFVYYLWQMILPLTVVSVMSWAGFWVQRDQIGVRIGVATSSILTLIAHRFVIASLLPRLPYMTRLDYFNVGSTLLVFLAMVGVVAAAYLASQEKEQLARSIDRAARVFFPVAYSALLIWFVWH